MKTAVIAFRLSLAERSALRRAVEADPEARSVSGFLQLAWRSRARPLLKGKRGLPPMIDGRRAEVVP
jgi:hypothetical protein